ncbi:MAG: peptidoglycan DD-metalloendopeptidase family protein [Desulfobacterales bacterium]|nr:peptidoglycan DD-metalloendopeptidase family protein [Desulfobacterales bacterium]
MISYGYDGKLVTSETFSGTLNKTLGYTYNNDFNITGFTYAGSTTNYTYDNDGLLIGAGSFTISRNAGNGLPEDVTNSALTLTRTFNGYGEVSDESYTVSGQGITSWVLARDNNGRINNKAETVAGISSNYVHTYDSMGRLLTVTKDGVLVEEYGYDENGTRVYEMNTLRGIAARSFSYDAEDHLLTVDAVNYQYDLDGFLTTRTNGADVTTYDYSSRGGLLSVSLPDNRFIEYVHDPLWRRIAKKVNGSIVEKYLWQGLTRLLAVYDGSNNLLMRFEYADARMPVAASIAGATYYLTYDQVGSLRIVANASGSVVKRIDYDSFGNIVADSNPAFIIPFGFAGGFYDIDTGHVRFGYRDYDPDIGRWTAKDPLLFEGEDTDLYGYVLNDPVNLIDPWGLEGYWPTDSQTVTSPFGPRGGGPHTGTDLRNPKGNSAYATDNGTVILLRKDKKGGNQIKILNDDGSVSGYAHTHWVDGLKMGDKVNAGDVIGSSDDSGSGKPHLHFTYRLCETCPKIDPETNKLWDAEPCH